jgi:ABC-2 type transport system permease protein
MLNILLDMRLYAHLVKMQIRAQAQYKVDLVLDVLSYFLVTAMEFVAFLCYFVPFPTMLGWHVGEVSLLVAVASLGFGLGELFGGGFDNFNVVIRQGEFDRVLLRPVTGLIQVATTQFRLRRLGRMTQAVGAFIVALYLLRDLQLTWTLLKLMALIFGVLSSALMFIAIQLLGATLCFWTVDAVELTNILTYGGREALSYPLTIYSQFLQRMFVFIIPLAFGTYIPVCFVLARPLPFGLPDWLVLLSPGVSLIFSLAALAVWRVGVRHYQSTGS